MSEKEKNVVEKNSRCKCPEPGGCLAHMNLGEAGGNGGRGQGEGIR